MDEFIGITLDSVRNMLHFLQLPWFNAKLRLVMWNYMDYPSRIAAVRWLYDPGTTWTAALVPLPNLVLSVDTMGVFENW